MAGTRRLTAVVRQRCPACLEGHVFRSTLRTLPACQLCGHRFEPSAEDRRRLNAVLAAVTAVLGVAVVAGAWRWLVPAYGRPFALLSAVFLCVLLLPGVVRYALVIRAHVEVALLERALR